MRITTVSRSKVPSTSRSGEDGAIIPVDNVLHSMWSGVDITMNGELISTTSQKYVYKSYIETILNNSHSTKEYQLKLSRYFGDDGDKDEDYVMNWNKGMCTILFPIIVP